MTNYSRSVLKSNGLHRPKNLPVKFGFSPKSTSTNIAKKLPLQRCFKPLLIALFNFSHKRPTFAFTSESGYTLAFRRRIAHNGLHAETGAFPPSSTVRLCAACEIALNAAFVTIDFAMLLYTYISRFPADPHYQRMSKSRKAAAINFIPQPLFVTPFNFTHKRPTFAFMGESGYTLGFRRKIAHKGTHGETGVFRMGALSLPSDCFVRFGNPAWPGFKTANFAAFGSWSETLLKNAESLRSSDALMRVAVPKASRPRWAA